jgi:hypothetical protein
VGRGNEVLPLLLPVPPVPVPPVPVPCAFLRVPRIPFGLPYLCSVEFFQTDLQCPLLCFLSHVDAYLFPCPSQDGPSQVKGCLNGLAGSSFGMLWFDIETDPSPGCSWSSSLTDNCNFLASMIQAVKDAGRSPGIYASNYMWGRIMGSSCRVGADNGVPLWYAAYDGEPNFNDYPGMAFGGWSSPNIKQYSDSYGACSGTFDHDWYPDGSLASWHPGVLPASNSSAPITSLRGSK